MLLKMQSRPSHYAVPSTLQSLQRSSYTNGYSDYLNYGTYPPLTPNLYQTPAYTSNNTSSISSSTYLYYGGGQPTTNTLLEEPSSPNVRVLIQYCMHADHYYFFFFLIYLFIYIYFFFNFLLINFILSLQNSTASPGNSNPQSPACVFSPTGNNSKGLNDSSSPPLSYDASASDMLYTKYPVSYTSIPQYASSSTTPSFSTCTPYSIENNSTFSNSHSLSGNSGNSTGSFSVYSNGYGSSSSSSSNTAGGVYNHCMPPSSSTLYTEQHLSSGYSTPASVNIGSSGSSFALWKLVKVSFCHRPNYHH